MTWKSAACVALCTVFTAFPKVSLADKRFGISSIGIDEMTEGSLQSLALYLKNLREAYVWRESPGRLIIDATNIRECKKDQFVLAATHRRAGAKYQDGVTFSRCGQTVGNYFVERSGPGVAAIADADLFSIALPLPTQSTGYRFHSSIYSIDILSNSAPEGRVSQVSFLLGAIPFHTLIREMKSIRGDLNIETRTYQISLYYKSVLSTGSFGEQRLQYSGSAPSFKYEIERSRIRYRNLSAARFHETYQANVEGNTVGTLSQLLSYPLKFPVVLDNTSFVVGN